MLSSMTGYGRAVTEWNEKQITVEIKAVNHRYFECSVRSPRALTFLDDTLRSRAAERIRRGKTEIILSLESRGSEPVEITYNEQYLSQWLTMLSRIAKEKKLKNDLAISDIARNPEIFTLHKPEEDQQQLAEAVLKTLDEALDAFCAARAREGGRLVEDLLARLDGIGAHVDALDARSPETVEEYRQKLLARMKEALSGITVDETRLLTEAAIYADKVTVAEETTRLRTHLDHFRSLLKGDGPIGKKLDFYMQEMNREINTVGSKCNDVQMTRTVIEVKNELENIREQIQNIE